MSQIEIFFRACVYSSVSAHKGRPKGFSKEVCYQNLLSTMDSRVHITPFLDIANEGDHFLKGKAIEIQAGTESGSFLQMLDYVMGLKFHPNTILYFLEDDYVHRVGWVDALLEAFSLDIDYVTLYDHKDKYMVYPKLLSKIFATKSCHWRTTPSTTNTYAMRFSTLKMDYQIHRKFSEKVKVTRDHEKFCYLQKKGKVLISSLPGYATHADPKHFSPCTHWDPFFTSHGP